MSKPQRPVIQFIVGDYLLSWRELAGLSQTQLADLSRQLYNAGTIDRVYTQGLISRMERSDNLHDTNLKAISTTLAIALQNAGQDDVKPDDLFRALRSAKRRRVDVRELDPQVLHFNSLLAGYPPHTRRIFWRAAEALLMGIDEQYRAEMGNLRRRITEKRQMRDNSENSV